MTPEIIQFKWGIIDIALAAKLRMLNRLGKIIYFDLMVDDLRTFEEVVRYFIPNYKRDHNRSRSILLKQSEPAFLIRTCNTERFALGNVNLLILNVTGEKKLEFILRLDKTTCGSKLFAVQGNEKQEQILFELPSRPGEWYKQCVVPKELNQHPIFPGEVRETICMPGISQEATVITHSDFSANSLDYLKVCNIDSPFRVMSNKNSVTDVLFSTINVPFMLYVAYAPNNIEKQVIVSMLFVRTIP